MTLQTNVSGGGPGADVEGKNLSDLLANRAAATPNKTAFLNKRQGVWEPMTWQQALHRAEEIALGLLSIGMQPGDPVAIIGGTRQEWTMSDFGLLVAGGVTVPIYPSSPAATVAYILGDSESAWVFIEDAKQLKKLLSIREQLSYVKQVIVWDGQSLSQLADKDSQQIKGWAITLQELIERGRSSGQAQTGEKLAEIRAKILSDSPATIIYTSGTTGDPKGVILDHNAFIIGGRYAKDALSLSPDALHIMFLPLSHSFAKMIQMVAVQVGFCNAFAESIEKVIDNCCELKPTFLCAVPRIFEKAYAKVLNNAKEGGAAKAAIFNWAVDVGLRASRELQAKRRPRGLLAVQYAIADKLVFSKLRERFGGRLRYFVSGSAPLSKDLAEFFHGAGLLILEGYGLTETNSQTTCNRLDHFKFGTVGPTLHEKLEMRIASDGEILTRGVSNLRGYYKQPEATKQAIDEDGWFHTGDIGEIDKDGFLRITDRKKDMIKTSGGKYVAPQLIEGQLKMDPIISQAVVIGDMRKYCSALIAVNMEVARKFLSDSNLPVPQSDEEILKLPVIEKRVQSKFDEINAKVGSWEQVKYFRFLPRELTEANGELTPTLKVKRKVVAEHYGKLIDTMYPDAAMSID